MLILASVMDISTSIDIQNSKNSGITYYIDRELAARLNDSNTSLESVNIVDYERFKDVVNFDITTLTLLTRIPKFILNKFKNLESLRIIEAGIQFLSPETFADGENLVQLDLRRNKFYSISEGVFSSLQKLEYLNLALNSITTIDDNAFKGLNSLKYLYLSDNKLTKVTGKTFEGLPSLQELLLDKNEIDTIEFDELNLPSLEILSVNGNNIRVLPSLKGCPRLEKVHFAQNKLTRIGDTFDHLNRLYMLDLNDNPNLEDIDLISITTRLPDLTYLLVGNTGFKLPQSGPNVPQDVVSDLRKLNLSRNNLSHTNILKHLTFFKELKDLDLSGNRFKHFSIDDIETTFPNLEKINIKQNALNATWLEEVLPVLRSNNIEVKV